MAHQHTDVRHRLGRLTPVRSGLAGLHRIGRRRFLRDLGGGTLAVAILGPAVVGCSDDDTSAAPTSGGDTSPTASTGPDEGQDTGTEQTQGLEWRQVALGNVSAYVLVRGAEAAVVDTGNPGSGRQIAASLDLLGASWADVRHIVLTHAHPDHVGSLGEVADAAPGAAVHAGAEDIASISAPVDIQVAADGDEIFGLEVIATPGHTPGSISVIDHGIGLLVAGDALNGNEAGTEITGPNPRYSSDMDRAWASVRTLAQFDFETAVFGHGNPYGPGASAAVAALV